MSAEKTEKKRRAGLRVRPFRADDAPALLDLQQRAILAIADTHCSLTQRQNWAAGLTLASYAPNLADGETIAVATTAAEQVVGFCSHRLCADAVGEICGLYVAPEAQGHGAGRALLAAAEATLVERGAAFFRVAASRSAVRFFSAAGYAASESGLQSTRAGFPLSARQYTKDADTTRPWRNFYGRRHGKKLRLSQQHLLEKRLAELSVPGSKWADNPDRLPIALPELFGRKSPVWLEIGFGGGEHMVATASKNPNVDLIGCEPFVNGVAMLLTQIENAGVKNLRIHPGDARDLFDVLPSGSLDRVYLLYPDPWPKKRHWKRRFVSQDNLDALAKVMAPGAELRIATDIPDYVRHSLEQIVRHPDFDWMADTPEDWRHAWAGWTGTRYEAKAIAAGRRPHYLRVQRL
ncbi:MAG: tRNA (guanosine(46)-N7)-methyltransferase TrmB [Pseudomonadota bacterium]